MRMLIIILGVVMLYSCSADKKHSMESKTFLQSKEIQLANPKIEVDHVIIDSSSSVTASLGLENANIFYTIDGGEPTQKSKKYIETIVVSEPGEYTFKAFHEDFKPSETETVTFYKKGMDVAHFSIISSLNEQYPGQGENTLVNHKKGSLNFRDGQWIGVTEPFIAEIDFKQKTVLESLDIGFLINTNAWIFPIEDVTIKISRDGDSFESLSVDFSNTPLTQDVSRLDNIHIPVLKELRKMRVEIANTTLIPEWHQGKSNPAWLFMDEWIFNTKKN